MAVIADVATLITAIGAFIVAIGGFYLILRVAALVDELREKVKGMKVE